MKGPTNESVGTSFKVDLLQNARNRTLEVILEAAKSVRAGMTENEAKTLIQSIQAQRGAAKSWHPPMIRFGKNTLLPFGQQGIENPILQENDIFFFDIGPIFEGHEGDVGRPFAFGKDPEMEKCCKDAGEIWQEVRNHWKTTGATGAALYDFGMKSAQNRGWVLTLDSANGHRIADFPHAAKMRGSIEGLDTTPSPNRWILEIQIRHPHKEFGAFYEDLLD